MKVLMLGPASSVHMQRWAKAVSNNGWNVILVSLPEDKWNNFDSNEFTNIKLIYLRISGKKGYYLNAAELNRIYNRELPNVVNAHYGSGYGTLARISKLKPLILSVWGSDVYDFPYTNIINNLIIKKNINAALYIASTSNCMALQTNKLMGRNVNCFITPFGVDTEKFKPLNNETKKDTFVFGIVKTLTQKYGIEYLIKAYDLFLKQIPLEEKRIELRIYGDGEDRNKLEDLVQNLNLSGVVFGGKIDNSKVPYVINNFDVFCCSSIRNSESFGVAAVEAMACGVPVIATDVDGFKEVIKNNETGILVQREDPVAMAKAMLYLYNNPEIRKTMGKNGRKRVMEYYNWDDNVNTMLKIYEKAKRT